MTRITRRLTFLLAGILVAYLAKNRITHPGPRPPTAIAEVTSSQRTDEESFVTLNCYWFLGPDEDFAEADKPKTEEEYTRKAGHLMGLLPPNAPRVVGLQEIGNQADVAFLSKVAEIRYHRPFTPLFAQGKDTVTKQDVGALVRCDTGWGIHGRPARHSLLERDLSKHLVFRITNAVTAIDVCVVHLRRPLGDDGKRKHRAQYVALLKWAAAQQDGNYVILGDFNEPKKEGDLDEMLRNTGLHDAFELQGQLPTHVDGGAYDRIIVSTSLWQGTEGYQVKALSVLKHAHGKSPHEYTDHFPVMLSLHRR